MHPDSEAPTNLASHEGDADLSATAVLGEVGIARPGLPRGTAVGRYLILDSLGHGGMGVVYKAYDPELNRPVALKLLRATGETNVLRERLVREAQALAQLSHPNVIAVHDVGTYGSDVFIAMEFVDGQTLHRWLARERPSRRRIVEVFLAAGEGLAAAHRAGLIHRDFKPENVMIGDDGRVRVLDFGVARAAIVEASPSSPASSRSSSQQRTDIDLAASSTGPRAKSNDGLTSTLLGSSLTHDGAIVGTPRFMAPEQHLGDVVDERADQFAFSVSLYRALYGTFPFAGEGIRDYRGRVIAGSIEEAPPKADVPRWLRKVLVRGLGRRPEDRFRSMDALLAALRADPRHQRRLWLPAVAAAVLLGVVGLVAYRESSKQRACEGANDKLAGVWDEGRRNALSAAFLASGKSYASAVSTTVAHVFDGYAKAWATMRREACEATLVRHEQSQELLDLRMACLAERLIVLRTLGDLYLHGDAKVLDGASHSAQALPPLEGCADVGALRAPMALPTDLETRKRVAAAREDVAKGEAMSLVQEFAEGTKVTTSALVTARALEYRPLEAEALYVLGLLEVGDGEVVASAKSLHGSLVAALAGGHDEYVAKASLALINAARYRPDQFEDGHRWVAVAEAALERLPHQEMLSAAYHANLASLLDDEGKYQEALVEYQKALTLKEKVRGPNHPSVASTLNNVAIVYEALGEYEEALAYHRRAYDIRLASYGPDHPTLATSLNNMGTILTTQGKYEEALAVAQRALAVKEKALGPNHPDLAYALNTIGGALTGLGRYEEAIAQSTRALAIRERSLGPDDPGVGIVCEHIGAALRDLHRYDEALAQFRRTLTIREKRLGASHPDLAYSLFDIASVLADQGKYDDALSSVRRAIGLREAKFGKTYPALVATLNLEGRIQLETRAFDAAIATFERAMAIADVGKGDPAEAAEARFGIANALTKAHRDGPRAVKLAKEARAIYAGRGRPFVTDVETVDRWLAQRR